jgi:hypothetical protein
VKTLEDKRSAGASRPVLSRGPETILLGIMRSFEDPESDFLEEEVIGEKSIATCLPVTHVQRRFSNQ